jgi:hypothetical protein
MLVVHDQPGPPPGVDAEYKAYSGITPPTRNIRRRLYKKKKVRPELFGIGQRRSFAVLCWKQKHFVCME